ncbi:MAG: hypothetical protein Q9161_009125 [Pseudevernia consocians]
MVFLQIALVVSCLFRLTAASPILTIPESPLQAYDVIIVGGGPAGLSAASALGRVRRSALLIDSGVYRNAPTQEVHDVLTRDGTVPAEFRALARDQISVYPSVSMMNGTVSSIVPKNNNTYFTTTDVEGKQYLSKKVILATGMKDLLPSTPGLAAGWGSGCPWCDGWEHRDKPFANLGPFSAAFVQNSITQTTLNPDILMLTNGTYNDTTKAQASKDLPDWTDRLALYNISVEDRIIASFSRVNKNDSDYNDDFRITFTDGESIVRNAIKGNFPAELASDIPTELGLKLSNESDATVQVDHNMESSMPGVFMIGDANSDMSHSVPHAMWSGKRAVVYMHGNLAKDYANARVEAQSIHTKRFLDDAQKPFEVMKKHLAKPKAELNSAQELLEYMSS